MRRIALIILILFLSLKAYSPIIKVVYISTPESINQYNRLFKAICRVESSGNILAYNSEENACGVAQIRSVRILHYNRLTGKDYSLEDCYSPEVSKEVFLFFAQGKTFEKAAKDWNGHGVKTIAYWNKVKKYL